MREVVLDASALIAFLRAEEGAERVAQALPAARICAVNLVEVISKLVSYGAALDEVVFRVAQLRLRVIPFDDTLSPLAASIHAGSRKFGYSLGDCCCLACGLLLDLPVLTTDSGWSLLDSRVRVEQIR